MRKISLMVGLLINLSIASSAYANHGSFAAIAYSPWTGNTGISWGQPTLGHAQSVALGYCASPDCHIAAWVNRGCTALAAGWNRQYGWAYGPNLWDVQNRALLYCGRTSYGCRVIAHTCSF